MRHPYLAGFALLLLPSPQIACAEEPNAATPVPVLVELFTSEGCSSCPPAEDEVARLEREQPVRGVRLVPIAFHVDYWNDLGWPDPFSSAAWTQHQRDYDRDGRLYTPQAVVQGGRECVGSDGSALEALARAAAAQASARVTVTRSAAAAGPSEIHASVAVAQLPPVTPGDRAEVRAILVERGVVVDVPRGENAGRRVHHAPMARDVASAGFVTAPGGSFEATLTIPATRHREGLDVVAIVQEHASHRVLGVGLLAHDAP